MKHRTLLVGLGGVGAQRHLPACLASEHVELVGLCDSKEQLLKEIGETSGISHLYTSLDKALKEAHPEICILAIPPQAHFAAASRCLASGIHVLVEKPLTPSLEEADQLIEAMRTSSVKAMVSENYRWFDGILDAHQMIEGGLVGEPRWVSIEVYCPPVPDYSNTGWLRTTDKLWFYEWGIHWVDIARYWLGEEAESVFARFPQVPEELEGEVINPTADHINAVLIQFENEKNAFILQYLVSKGVNAFTVEAKIEGTRGQIALSMDAESNFYTTVSLRQANGTVQQRTFSYKAKLDLAIVSHRRTLEHFVHCIEEDVRPITGLEDNRKTLAITLSAYESAQRRGPVRVAAA